MQKALRKENEISKKFSEQRKEPHKWENCSCELDEDDRKMIVSLFDYRAFPTFDLVGPFITKHVMKNRNCT